MSLPSFSGFIAENGILIIPWSTYYERSERIKGSWSTYDLERSERQKGPSLPITSSEARG